MNSTACSYKERQSTSKSNTGNGLGTTPFYELKAFLHKLPSVCSEKMKLHKTTIKKVYLQREKEQ